VRGDFPKQSWTDNDFLGLYRYIDARRNPFYFGEGLMSPENFLRRFLILIALAWNIPPVFGLGLLVYIGMFTSDQMLIILSTPLEPAFILLSMAFAIWYFWRFAQPVCAFLRDRSHENTEAAVRHIRRFPLDFWLVFLIYLIVAPSTVIGSAEYYAGFQPLPLDWFRIHLVALIVSIIVGLPIFFIVLDLFGQALSGVALDKPHVTVKLKVFLIGALVPLLVDTMLVQYYWTRTGYFSAETFGVWLLLEVMAIAGSLIFVRSFGQSMHPLQEVIGLHTAFAEMDLSRLTSQSTDELGVLAEDFRKLLEDLRVRNSLLEINNRVLRFSGSEANMEQLVTMILDTCQSAVGGDIIFLILHDAEKNELVGVAQTGTDYSSSGHFRLSLDDISMAAMIFKEGQTVAINDCGNDPRVSPAMVKRFNIRSALGSPLQIDGNVIGVLMSVGQNDAHKYSVQEIMLMEMFAREAAMAVNSRLLQESRTRAEQRYQKLNQLAPDAIFLLDPNLQVLEANSAAAKLLGLLGDLRGRNLADFLDDDLGELQRLAAGTEDGTSHFEATILRSDMVRIPVEVHANRPIADEPLIQAFFRDISAIRKSREELYHMAHHDPLTQLPNRLLFLDRLGHALELARREGRKIAVLFLDLDRFKNVNDTLGHPTGDKLLQEVAKQIKSRVREEDTLGRLGGDEFVLLIEKLVDEREASMVAQKLLEAFVQPFAVEGHELFLSASIGISLFPMDGQNGATLVRNADTAMYRAKDQGRNNFQFYTHEMTASAIERVALENALRRALERGELLLHYQPQIDLNNGSLIGAEALIRWQHPKMGLVMPGRFIHLAEESGLIRPIGEWVLFNACDQMRQWREQGFILPRIAVNLSGHQLHKDGIVEQVQSVLRGTKLEPDWLELEITESFIMRQAEDAIGMLNQLKELGVQLAIDDFGTGYSSLSYLKRLPVHKLKIDQSFVHGIPDDVNDSSIARAVIALGRSMQLRVIAEGVETEQQQAFLRAEGCDEGQGYLYSRPVSATDFLSTWHTHRKAKII
jgi:diguanylate cyclase (GGDEF)-like protein/PAS domain S-box-containing protein